jgi:nitrogen-specific signal transduction histidine kinase
MNIEAEILENIEFPIIVLDKDKNIKYLNVAAKELKVLLDSQKFLQLITYPLSLPIVKNGYSVKGIIKEIDKSKYLMDVFFIPGKQLYIILIRDITRFAELEERMKKEGSVFTVNHILSEIFHEMKGPVGGIKACAQLLKEQPDDEELIDDILSETKRLENLINEITFLSKEVPLKKEIKNIHKIIRQTLKLFKTQHKNVKFSEKFDPSLPDIPVDEELFKRVLINLIRNSIEAINENGFIEIETGISWDKIYSPLGDKIYIKIKDSGEGIPDEIKDKLFYPLTSTKKNGMGLGLSISYKIIKDHKGIIRYIGNSTFEILLPIKGEK